MWSHLLTDQNGALEFNQFIHHFGHSHKSAGRKFRSIYSELFRETFHENIDLDLLTTCSKLTIEQGVKYVQRHQSVFIVNLEHISHLALVFLLLT